MAGEGDQVGQGRVELKAPGGQSCRTLQAWCQHLRGAPPQC